MNFTAAYPGVQMTQMIQHSSQNIYAFVFKNKYCIQYDPKILFEFCMFIFNFCSSAYNMLDYTSTTSYINVIIFT